MLEVRLLGQFDVRCDGQPIAIPSRPAQSLLAYLLLNAGIPQRREKIAGLLWPDATEANARSNLRFQLWRLRKAIETESGRRRPQTYILADDIAITFDTNAEYWLDLSILECAASEQATTGDLMSLLSLYRGELLPGFYEDWVVLERERLQAIFEQQVQRLLDKLVEEQRWGEVLEWGERWIAFGQTPEPAYRALMLAHGARGDLSKVVSTYQRCVESLRKELDVEPSEQTQALLARLTHGEKIVLALQPHAVPAALPSKDLRGDEPPAPGEPPFKGLQYFEEADADVFFGREALTTKLVGHLRQERFLAVIGASGSGKSSIVRAGVVPALKRGNPLSDGALSLEGRARWRIHVMTPTAHPLEAMATSLTYDSESVTTTAALMDALVSEPRSLYLYARRALTSNPSPLRAGDGRKVEGERLLLVVDQFEELFTLCRDEFEREAFVDNLLTAVTPGTEEVTRVVITLRADFYTHCAQYDNLREAMAAHQEYIGPMSESELRRAIEEPAACGGWEFEPGLVDLILRDAGDEPGALPLLSHALLETWKRRSGCRLTLKGYADSGGVRSAIAKTAETVYRSLAPEQQGIARNIFVRLTELGEGTQDTRHRATLSELILRPEEASAVQAVVKTLADARLITTGEGTVEVAHEALIREWPTLREWLNQDREGLRLHRRLTEGAREWDRLNRDAGGLYRGVNLAQALEWATMNPDALNALERAFLDASKEAAAREEAEREAQQQRELVAAQKLAAAERRRAEEQSRAARQLRQRALFLAGALVIALLMTGAALFFGDQSRKSALTALANAGAAEKERRTALSRELAMAAISNLNADPQLGILLALQAVSVTYSVDKSVLPEAEDALHRAVQAAHVPLVLSGHPGRVEHLIFSADGTRILTTTLVPQLITKVWDTATGKELATLPGLAVGGYWLDSNRISTLAPADVNTTELAFWDVSSQQKLSKVVLPASFDNVADTRFRNVNDARLNRNGERIAIAFGDKTARVYDTRTGKEQLTLVGHTAGVNAILFSPDGTRLATASDDSTAKVWDAATGNELYSLTGHSNQVIDIAFSPDGKRIGTASIDGTAKIWDAESGKDILTLSGHTASVFAIAFSADGTRIATGSVDRHAIVWDAFTGRALTTIEGHRNSVRFVAFSPDGRRLATASDDQTAKVWDLEPGNEVSTLFTGRVYLLNASRDGTRIVTSHPDNTAKVWDIATGKLLMTLVGHLDLVLGAIFSPDGKRIATASADKTVKVWDATTGKELLTLAGHSSRVWDVVFSPDGTRLVTTSNDGTAKVWDLANGKEMMTFSGHAGPVYATAFSSDGRYIATAGADQTVRLWDAASGHSLFNLTGHTGAVWDVAFSRDGNRLVTASQDRTARVWDALNGRVLFTLTGHTATVLRASFNAEGTRIATGSEDGTAKLWDAMTGKALLTLYGHAKAVNGIAFSPDGKYLLTSSEDGTVRVDVLPIQDLIELARARLTRTWTLDECQKFLHAAQCPPTP